MLARGDFLARPSGRQHVEGRVGVCMGAALDPIGIKLPDLVPGEHGSVRLPFASQPAAGATNEASCNVERRRIAITQENWKCRLMEIGESIVKCQQYRFFGEIAHVITAAPVILV